MRSSDEPGDGQHLSLRATDGCVRSVERVGKRLRRYRVEHESDANTRH
jgi:hypothetical protein